VLFCLGSIWSVTDELNPSWYGALLMRRRIDAGAPTSDETLLPRRQAAPARLRAGRPACAGGAWVWPPACARTYYAGAPRTHRLHGTLEQGGGSLAAPYSTWVRGWRTPASLAY
jgi:hypothetical protein